MGAMQIKIPRPITRAWDAFCDWGDMPAWKRGRFEIRRLDVLTVVVGILATSFYVWVYDWRSGLIAAMLYVFGVMISLWIF
jgi:hypothetical protein